MAISTYSELKTAVANWLARSDLTDRIPEFIVLAEAKFNRTLTVREMEQRAITNVDTTSDEPEFITLPDDFQAMRTLRITSVTDAPVVTYLAPAQFNDMRYSLIGDTTGQPRYFTILSGEMELLPIPDDNYELEMVYRKNVPALSDSTATNWLLTKAPDLYLYGALLEAEVFMQGDERVPLWAQGASTAIDGLIRQSLSASFNAGPVTMRISGVTP